MIHTFSQDAMERITRAVKRVEQMPKGSVIRRGKLAEGTGLPAYPTVKSVLIYDPDATPELKWIELEEFTCPT